MTRATSLLAGAVAAIGLAGCGGGAGMTAALAGMEGPRSVDAQIHVTNDNWADMRIFAERDGLRVRLGMVTAMASAVFQLPRRLLQPGGDIRLIADPVGSRDHHVTHGLTIWPGQVVNYQISNHLAVSSAAVYDR
jgi:hypothetical protein